MENIIQKLTDFYQDNKVHPTHMLLNNKDYDKIMLDNGVITHGKVPFKELYGLTLIITDYPTEIKLLKMEK